MFGLLQLRNLIATDFDWKNSNFSNRIKFSRQTFVNYYGLIGFVYTLNRSRFIDTLSRRRLISISGTRRICTVRFRKVGRMWCGGARRTYWATRHNGVTLIKTKEFLKSPCFLDLNGRRRKGILKGLKINKNSSSDFNDGS